MPEEIDRTEIAPKCVKDQCEIDPEQNRMSEPRELHHQEEHEQADNEILGGVGALPPDRDVFVFVQEIYKRIEADADVERDERVIGARRQPGIEVALPVHEQYLQDERDRHHARDQLLRTAVARVEIPDQPDELDQRKDQDQIADRRDALDPTDAHVGRRSSWRLP